MLMQIVMKRIMPDKCADEMQASCWMESDQDLETEQISGSCTGTFCNILLSFTLLQPHLLVGDPKMLLMSFLAGEHLASHHLHLKLPVLMVFLCMSSFAVFYEFKTGGLPYVCLPEPSVKSTALASEAESA